VWYWNVDAAHLDAFMTDREGIRQPVSVPPGSVREDLVRSLQERARDELPPQLAEVVVHTPRPFLQLIGDVEVIRMASRRTCLVGDAAFVARPHVAAGTAKAAEDAWQLSQALVRCGGDVEAALGLWEPRQRGLGARVVARAREVGQRMQVEGTWPIGAPLPYGLYEAGDSEFEFS
jgi:2,6-dihydroxypyridine 3-monooxygenase